MAIRIETTRLILREISLQDEEGLFLLDSDPAVHTYIGNKPLTSKDEVKKIIAFIQQQYIDNGIGRWAVIEKESQSFIGWAGLKLVKEVVNNHTNYYELGYRFIQKHWGKGYATEAARAVLDYGFCTMSLSKIYAIADCGNTSSQHVLYKLGFSHLASFDYNGIPHYWYSNDCNT
jgi:[ribosomal protein S5]-alanine N-acetyltransferase